MENSDTLDLGYETLYLYKLEDIMNYCLKLRSKGFWSFRGQRLHEWRLGLHRPNPQESMSELLNQFKKRCLEVGEPNFTGEFAEWRWLFYAQHHRLKTRLLDWTSNPLVAIYFAVENILSSKNDRDDIGAVWAINMEKAYFKSPKDLSRTPVELEGWTMINPTPISPRISRQSAKFSYHPRKDAVSIDRPHPGRHVRLKKIILTKDKKNDKNFSKKIRQQLGIMNIHHASMFPDHDGIAAFISHEWKDLQNY